MVVLMAFFFAAGADEGELFRQIKNDVLDAKWDAVLEGCDQFISQFPRGQGLPRAYFYRAQALEHMKGREAQAIEAFKQFLDKFPAETGPIKEDALLSRMTLAVSLWLKGDKKHVGVITTGMDLPGYPRTYAAIQASKIDHAPARAKALPILKGCASTEADAGLKNECRVALLRIDPESATKIQQQEKPRVTPPGGEARLIRVQVYDKAKKKVTVGVNMPLAFTEILLESLSDEIRKEIGDHLQDKGVSLERFWDAIKKGGKQTLIEIDDENHTIKVWVE